MKAISCQNCQEKLHTVLIFSNGTNMKPLGAEKKVLSLKGFYFGQKCQVVKGLQTCCMDSALYKDYICVKEESRLVNITEGEP